MSKDALPEVEKFTPAKKGSKMGLGDFAVIGAAVLLVATVALQLIALKALFLF